MQDVHLIKKEKLRFLEYIYLLETSKEYGILSFQMNHLLEINYTKKELFTYFNTSKHDILSGQCMATIIMIQKKKHSLFILNEWYRMSSIYELLQTVFGVRWLLYVQRGGRTV